MGNPSEKAGLNSPTGGDHVFLPPRISQALEEILGKKLTVIEAGAGYGKTALLSSWIAGRQLSCFWYAMDQLNNHKNFLESCDWNLEQLGTQNPILLVFDNWDAFAEGQKKQNRDMPAEEDIRGTLANLLFSTPANAHIVICTRHAPNLMEELLPEEEVLRIEERVLAFKSEEISSILARTYNIILPLEQTEWFTKITEGWPQAVHATGKVIARLGEGWNFNEALQALRQEILPYFLTTVWEQLSPDKQEVLLQLSVPGEISLELLAPLLGRETYANNLAWAVGNHLFLRRLPYHYPAPFGFQSSHDPDTWHFHGLFRDFLRSRLLGNPQAFCALNLEIGKQYLEMDKKEEALPYLIQAKSYPEACQTMEDLLPFFLPDRLVEMEELMAMIPTEVDKYFPNLLFTFGEALTKNGRMGDGLTWLRRASLVYGQLGDALGITRTLCALGTACTALGLTEEAEAVYRQASREIPADETNRAIVQAYLNTYRQFARTIEPPGPKLKVCCLGPFALSRGNEALIFAKWRRKAIQVLKYLAIQPAHKASKEQLIDLFWPEETAEKAGNSYYVTLHSLRQGLSAGLPAMVNYLEVEKGTVSLIPELLVGVDIDEFIVMTQEGRRLGHSNPAQAVHSFQRARALYRGDLLSDDLYEEWVFLPRDHLKALFLESLTYLAKYASIKSQGEIALELWNEIIQHDATNESAVREAMALMADLGRKTEALQAYRRLYNSLKSELNTEPELLTKKLYNKIMGNP